MLGFFAVAGQAAPPEESAWRLWLEPAFMHAPGAVAIPGAKRTELAGGYLTAFGLETIPAADFTGLGEGWAAFQKRARQNAELDLLKTKTEYVRNRQRIIEYALVRSPEGLVPSAVLAPKFLAQFSETLGPTVVLLVPNRTTAWVFPRLASTWPDHAAEIIAAYRATPWPVSLEIFELGPEGLKGVGTFTDPAVRE